MRVLTMVCFLAVSNLAWAGEVENSDQIRFMDVAATGVKGDFVTRFVKRSPVVTKRKGYGIYQFPMSGSRDEVGPCGSQHIRPERTKPFMRPVSACMFTAFAEEWKKKFCPDDSPDCQLLFGDMSYGDQRPREWPHSTHHDGQCVDIWPIRKPGYSGELDIHSKGYDHERTMQMTKLLKKWGAETRDEKTPKAQFFFNDPLIVADQSIQIRRLANHDDHIHVCFRSNDLNYQRCKGYTIDTKACPTLR